MYFILLLYIGFLLVFGLLSSSCWACLGNVNSDFGKQPVANNTKFFNKAGILILSFNFNNGANNIQPLI